MTAIVDTWPTAMPWLVRIDFGPALSTQPAEPGPVYVLHLETANEQDLDRFRTDGAHRRLSEFLSSQPYRVKMADFVSTGGPA